MSANMEKWKKRWEDNQLRWHRNEVDPHLQKYFSEFQKEDIKNSVDGRIAKTVFVPLCGKSLDIGYILSLGFSVFAVEGVRTAIDALNAENDFGLKFHEQDSIYRSREGKLEIYFGDLFTCPIEKWGPFDYVWDKGSLTAINEECRAEYAAMMRKSVQFSDGKYSNFKYLLRTVQYDKSNWNGKGPKCVSENDMKILYGSWTNAKLVESSLLPDSHVCRLSVEVGLKCHENVYLLTNKD